jgi:hypothetical protein
MNAVVARELSMAKQMRSPLAPGDGPVVLPTLSGEYVPAYRPKLEDD